MSTIQVEARKPMIIGLMGQKQSGKDTVADILGLDYGFMKIAFADALKDSLIAFDPWLVQPAERLSVLVKREGWDVVKGKYPEVRKMLQRLGTDVGRDILGEDIWTRIMRTKLEQAIANGADVVIPDVRFLNEAQTVLDYGGTLVRIARPGLPDEDMHVSEHEWRRVMPDLLINNDGTFEELREAVSLMILVMHVAASVEGE